MPETKLNNRQLPNTLSSKTIDNTNDINTTLTRLKISGGTNGQVLSTDGSSNLSWTTAGGGGISDGDKGDITVSGGGTVWTIDAGAVVEADIANNAVSTNKIANDAVTYAKMQNVSATSRLLGRASSGAGDVEEITIGSGLSLTGTTLSASGGGGGGDIPTFMVVKSVDETVLNSDTLQVDDELIFTGLVETHYYFEAVIYWHRTGISGSGDQPGIKIAFGNEVSTNGFFSTIPGNTTTTPTGASGIANVSYSPSIFRPIACKVSGSFYVLAGQNARLWFRWAQVTPSSTIGTVVQKGSKLLVWKLT